MNGDVIPDQHNVARYCGPQHVDDGLILGSAFLLKENEDSGLSVNWLEMLACNNRHREIAELRKIYDVKALGVGQKARRDAKIVVMNVGEARQKVLESEARRSLSVLHHPLIDDPSHSGIHNLRPHNEMIAEIILQAIRETYPRSK